MPRGIMYQFMCQICDVLSDRQVPYEERDQQKCDVCQGNLIRMYTPPHSTRASYVDGVKRKGWSEMREASKLNREAADSAPARRKEIEREIRKMGVDISKKGG